MRRHVGGARCGACGLGFAIPAPGRLGSPSALLRGLPSVAGRGRMKGGESRPDNVRDIPPVRPRKYGPEVKKRHSGAPGGGRAGHMARGTFAKVPDVIQRLSALRSLMGVREGKDGGPHAEPTTGTMTHACGAFNSPQPG